MSDLESDIRETDIASAPYSAYSPALRSASRAKKLGNRSFVHLIRLNPARDGGFRTCNPLALREGFPQGTSPTTPRRFAVCIRLGPRRAARGPSYLLARCG